MLIHGELINKTQSAKEEYEIAQAREKLTLTLGSAGIEKKLNKTYNQNEFLDEFILEDIPNTKIQGDVVIVDGYAFEIDRSIPTIGKYVGKENELIFPEINANVTNAEDSRTAIITITAKEEENGISKIEILQDGLVIKEYLYENVKEEIIAEYKAKQNGIYTIKAYGTLTATEKIEVSGLIALVQYSPNGNEEYKKEHKVKVTVDETVEKVKNIKYQWTQTTEEPTEDTFTENCNNGDTIAKKDITGKWYLWTLLETESGKTNIGRSEGFHFDNKGPTITLISTPVSESSFTLTATAHDNETKVVKYEFFIDGDKLPKETIETDEETASYTVTGVETGNTDCYAIVTDVLGNTSKTTVTGQTKVYVWEKYSVKETSTYKSVIGNKAGNMLTWCNTGATRWCRRAFDRNNGHYVDCGSFTCYAYFPGQFLYGSSYDVGSTLGGKNLYACLVGRENRFGSIYLNIDFYVASSVKDKTTYSKGSTKYPNVTSTNQTQYPTNSYQGEYWYVYKGIQ